MSKELGKGWVIKCVCVLWMGFPMTKREQGMGERAKGCVLQSSASGG